MHEGYNIGICTLVDAQKLKDDNEYESLNRFIKSYQRCRSNTELLVGFTNTTSPIDKILPGEADIRAMSADSWGDLIDNIDTDSVVLMDFHIRLGKSLLRRTARAYKENYALVPIYWMSFDFTSGAWNDTHTDIISSCKSDFQNLDNYSSLAGIFPKIYGKRRLRCPGLVKNSSLFEW